MYSQVMALWVYNPTSTFHKKETQATTPIHNTTTTLKMST